MKTAPADPLQKDNDDTPSADLWKNTTELSTVEQHYDPRWLRAYDDNDNESQDQLLFPKGSRNMVGGQVVVTTPRFQNTIRPSRLTVD